MIINRITYDEYLAEHPGDPFGLMEKFSAHKNVYSVQCRELPGTYVLSPLYKAHNDPLIPVSKKLVKRIEKLVKGVKVDLEEKLDDEHETDT